jgi:hypothetical protein
MIQKRYYWDSFFAATTRAADFINSIDPKRTSNEPGVFGGLDEAQRRSIFADFEVW